MTCKGLSIMLHTLVLVIDEKVWNIVSLIRKNFECSAPGFDTPPSTSNQGQKSKRALLFYYPNTDTFLCVTNRVLSFHIL